MDLTYFINVQSYFWTETLFRAWSGLRPDRVPGSGFRPDPKNAQVALAKAMIYPVDNLGFFYGIADEKS